MMKLFNTLTRRLEDFEPISRDRVKLYTCGPTVYDYPHIGNLRAFVFDDTLRRALEINSFSVVHVMNITDVGHLSSDMDEGEDKLEKGAQREAKSVWDVAGFYIDAFKNDMSALNVLEPNGYKGNDGPYARATDFIGQQIEITQILLTKGFAYQTEQAVYFDVSKLEDYGKLTGQKLSEKETAARADVITDSAKRNPQDFALWFMAVGRFSNHSMRWPSPWGEGFPGWHLECSAIIHATLGEPIDIHTGGVDHIGTHHTNEIAQTEAAYNVKLANYWLHNEHLLFNAKKMSKSEGDYITLKSLTDKGYKPSALRLFYLQSHYRTQSSFSWEAVAAAAKSLADLQAMSDIRWQADDTAKILEEGYFLDCRRRILSELSDDLKTPAALAVLYESADKITQNGINPANMQNLNSYLEFLDKALGLNLLGSEDITDEHKRLISERLAARKNQDWQRADEIRQNLLEQGLELSDKADSTIWRRI